MFKPTGTPQPQKRYKDAHGALVTVESVSHNPAVYRTFSRIYHNFSIIFIINRESPESWRDRRGCHGVGRTTSQEA